MCTVRCVTNMLLSFDICWLFVSKKFAYVVVVPLVAREGYFSRGRTDSVTEKTVLWPGLKFVYILKCCVCLTAHVTTTVYIYGK